MRYPKAFALAVVFSLAFCQTTVFADEVGTLENEELVSYDVDGSTTDSSNTELDEIGIDVETEVEQEELPQAAPVDDVISSETEYSQEEESEKVEASTQSDASSGWVKDDSETGERLWRYYRSGEPVYGLQVIDGSTYFFDEETGFLSFNRTHAIDDRMLLFGEDGKLITNSGWKLCGNNWYWVLEDGSVCVGWKKVKGVWYYLDTADGTMKSDEVFEVAEKTYVANASGACPANGWVKVDGSWYLTDGSCAARTGWAWKGGAWYYLDPSTHVMKESEAFAVGKKTYVANASGACPANGWVKVDGSWYLTDGSCAARTGWAWKGGAWYYFDPKADENGIVGKMMTGELTVGGKRYFLKNSGAMAVNEFVTTSNGVETFADSSGVLGMYRIGGVYYNADGSRMNGWVKLSSKWYYFDPSTGKMTYGWLKDSNHWYWFDSSGAMVTGRRTVDGKVYLFASSGEMVKSGWQNPAAYPQVSSKTVTLPSYAKGSHTYVTASRISVGATREECIEAFIGRAYEYLGTPFREPWSDAPGVGVDCSGLVLQCLYATGMDLEHAAGTSRVGGYNPYNHYYVPAQTYNSMRWYESDTFMPISIGSMRRGDLVFYTGHVAIYLGNGKIIHSTSATGNVCISDVNIWPVIGAQRPFV